jgi:hypothetical protein
MCLSHLKGYYLQAAGITVTDHPKPVEKIIIPIDPNFEKPTE